MYLTLFQSKFDLEKGYMEKEANLNNQIQEKVHEREILEKTEEKNKVVLELKVDNIISTLFSKLCEKSGLSEEKSIEYMKPFYEDVEQKMEDKLKHIQNILRKEKKFY